MSQVDGPLSIDQVELLVPKRRTTSDITDKILLRRRAIVPLSLVLPFSNNQNQDGQGQQSSSEQPSGIAGKVDLTNHSNDSPDHKTKNKFQLLPIFGRKSQAVFQKSKTPTNRNPKSQHKIQRIEGQDEKLEICESPKNKLKKLSSSPISQAQDNLLKIPNFKQLSSPQKSKKRVNSQMYRKTSIFSNYPINLTQCVIDAKPLSSVKSSTSYQSSSQSEVKSELLANDDEHDQFLVTRPSDQSLLGKVIKLLEKRKIQEKDGIDSKPFESKSFLQNGINALLSSFMPSWMVHIVDFNISILRILIQYQFNQLQTSVQPKPYPNRNIFFIILGILHSINLIESWPQRNKEVTFLRQSPQSILSIFVCGILLITNNQCKSGKVVKSRNQSPQQENENLVGNHEGLNVTNRFVKQLHELLMGAKGSLSVLFGLSLALIPQRETNSLVQYAMMLICSFAIQNFIITNMCSIKMQVLKFSCVQGVAVPYFSFRLVNGKCSFLTADNAQQVSSNLYLIISAIVTFLSTLQGFQSIDLQHRNNKNNQKVSKLRQQNIQNLKGLPYGVLIYNQSKGEIIKRNSQISHSGFEKLLEVFNDRIKRGKTIENNKVIENLKIVLGNQRLHKILNPQNLTLFDLDELLKQKKFRITANGQDKKTQLMSLEEILSQSEKRNFLVQYFVDSQNSLSDQQSKSSSLFKYEEKSDNKEIKKVKMIYNLQMGMQEIQIGEDKYKLLIIMDVNNIIRDNSIRNQNYYQDAIISTVSHEQMNPLNSIINMSNCLIDQIIELLLNSEESDNLDDQDDNQTVTVTKGCLKDQVKLIQIIYNSSEMMKLLNNAMVNSSKIKQNQYESVLEDVQDPLLFVRELVQLFQLQMLEKELSLDISEEVEGNPLAKSLLLSRGVKIDVNLNKQILYNILLNACKFNKQNGSISISVEVQIPDSLQDSKYQKRVRKINDLELIIKIVDTGFGMNKSKLNSLFKLFHKVKKSAVVGIDNEDGATIKELRTSGHGLGMFLSDSLVKFLKGNIQVDSIPDVGTTVKVTQQVKLALESTMTVQENSPNNNDLSPLSTSRRLVHIPQQIAELISGQSVSESIKNFIEKKKNFNSPARRIIVERSISSNSDASQSPSCESNLFKLVQKPLQQTQLDSNKWNGSFGQSKGKVSDNSPCSKTSTVSMMQVEAFNSKKVNDQIDTQLYGEKNLKLTSPVPNGTQLFGNQKGLSSFKRQESLLSEYDSECSQKEQNQGLRQGQNQLRVNTSQDQQMVKTFSKSTLEAQSALDPVLKVEEHKAHRSSTLELNIINQKNDSLVLEENQTIQHKRTNTPTDESIQIVANKILQQEYVDSGSSISHNVYDSNKEMQQESLQIVDRNEDNVQDCDLEESYFQEDDQCCLSAQLKEMNFRTTLSFKDVNQTNQNLQYLDSDQSQDYPQQFEELKNEQERTIQNKDLDNDDLGETQQRQICQQIDGRSVSIDEEPNNTDNSKVNSDITNKYIPRFFKINQVTTPASETAKSLRSNSVTNNQLNQLQVSIQQDHESVWRDRINSSNSLSNSKLPSSNSVRQIRQRKPPRHHPSQTLFNNVLLCENEETKSNKFSTGQKKQNSSFQNYRFRLNLNRENCQELNQSVPISRKKSQICTSSKDLKDITSENSKVERKGSIASFDLKSFRIERQHSQNKIELYSICACPCGMAPIMVVDDNPFNIETLKMLITKITKIVPDTANDGNVAVEKFIQRYKTLTSSTDQQNQGQLCNIDCTNRYYSLIFMDLNMPGMDGFTATQEIIEYQKNNRKKNGGAIPEVTIVALTAFSDKNNLDRSREVGMREVMNKPAEAKDLCNVMLKYCSFLKRKIEE